MDSPSQRLNRPERYFETFARRVGWNPTKKGWPDFVIHLDNGEAIAVEVKPSGDSLTAAQFETMCLLHRKGVICFVYVLRFTRGAKTEGVLIAFDPHKGKEFIYR